MLTNFKFLGSHFFLRKYFLTQHKEDSIVFRVTLPRKVGHCCPWFDREPLLVVCSRNARACLSGGRVPPSSARKMGHIV